MPYVDVIGVVWHPFIEALFFGQSGILHARSWILRMRDFWPVFLGPKPSFFMVLLSKGVEWTCISIALSFEIN